jgi:hypothetical protein
MDNQVRSIEKTNSNKEELVKKYKNIKIKEPEATELWEWLQKNGYNHPDSSKVLEELYYTRGALKYYRELIEAVNSKKLTDKISAQIINILGGIYSGKGDNSQYLYIAKDEKDKAIQNLIMNQVESPTGKESLYEALDSLSYVVDNNEIQEILDNLSDEHIALISKATLDKLKIRHAQFNDDPTVLYEVLKNVPQDERKELLPTIIDVINLDVYNDDKALMKEFRMVLQQNQPEQIVAYNQKEFDKKFDEKFPEPQEITNIENLSEHISNEYKKSYEIERTKIYAKQKEFTQWIKAYAYTLNHKDRYEFYKNKIKHSTLDESCAIINMIFEEKEAYNDEYIKYSLEIQDDLDLTDYLNRCEEYWIDH